MSLQTDRFFFQALSTSAGISVEVDERIYNTAIPVPDEKLDNVPVPYIIIENQGTQNALDTKDEVGEGDTDTDTIAIMVVARDREALARLAEMVRQRIKTAWEESIPEAWDGLPFEIADYRFSASGIIMDVMKPCVWQTLTYVCATNKI